MMNRSMFSAVTTMVLAAVIVIIIQKLQKENLLFPECNPDSKLEFGDEPFLDKAK